MGSGNPAFPPRALKCEPLRAEPGRRRRVGSAEPELRQGVGDMRIGRVVRTLEIWPGEAPLPERVILGDASGEPRVVVIPEPVPAAG